MTKQIDAKLKLVTEEFDKLKADQEVDKKNIQGLQQQMSQRGTRLAQLQGEHKALTELKTEDKKVK